MRFLAPALLIGASLALALSLGEAAVRWTGHSPWTPLPRFDGIPTVTGADPELGWVNQPGSYRFSAVPGQAAAQVTIAADGSRRSGADSETDADGATVWVTGCSLTYGWGVDDDQTYAAVAERELRARGMDAARLANLGVAGYGTLQTWQLFRRHAQTQRPPRVVLYGFFGGHGERNLAMPNFIRTLDRAASQQAWVKMPYARLDAAGALSLYPPQRYRRWPGAGRSALINLAQETADQFLRHRLEPTQHRVTLGLIERYAGEAKAAGAKFVVLILHLGEADRPVIAGLEARGIAYLDLTGMGFPGPGTIIEGDGHPNAMMHARWGKRLADYLEPTLRAAEPPTALAAAIPPAAAAGRIVQSAAIVSR